MNFRARYAGHALLITGALLITPGLSAPTTNPALGDQPSTAETKKAGKSDSAEPVQRKAVLLTLSGQLSEAVQPPGLFGDIQPNLRQMLQRLDRAANDDEVQAVILRIRQPAIGRAKLAELRHAISRLRREGKRVYADLNMAMPADYLLACACDQIVMPQSGTLLLPGVHAEVVFFKELFEKVGLDADLLQVGEFKGAAEPFTRVGMSDAFRKQYELVLDDLFDQMVDTIAADRQMDRQRVKQLIDQGLFTANAARKSGLIDKVAYPDQYEQHLQKQLSADSLQLVRNYGRKKVDTDFSGMTGMFKLLELITGSGAESNDSKKNQKIALVSAVGAIHSGRSSADLLGTHSVGSDTIVKALKTAEKDESVAAIVLRVDSPGGSALASDLIWRQVRQCDKPIVASMGDVAASGGYYIAMGCDKIVAADGTLTGSIGVVGGKIVIGELMEKVGVNSEVIARGQNAGLFSTSQQFSDSQRAVFKESMKEIYQQFTSKAAAGREMDLARLKSLAGGRIWTGRQAVHHGLVDQLGTQHDAIALAQQLAGIASGTEPEIIVLPKARTFLEQLLSHDAQIDAASLPQQLTGLAAPQLANAYRLMREPVLLWLPYRITIR